jgi:uncharacterized protein YhaN
MEVVMVVSATDLMQSLKELRTTFGTVYLKVENHQFQALTGRHQDVCSKVRDAISFENKTISLSSETVKEILSTIKNCREDDFVMLYDKDYKIL